MRAGRNVHARRSACKRKSGSGIVVARSRRALNGGDRTRSGDRAGKGHTAASAQPSRTACAPVAALELDDEQEHWSRLLLRDGCGSAVWADCTPADAWSSSKSEAAFMASG